MKIAKLSGKPEIFYSIQGEGVSTGMPSVFMRMSLCNLHCIWCDTDYTWNWEGTPFPHDNDKSQGYGKFKKEDQIIDMSLTEVANEIGKHPCNRLIITGGEPLMHQQELPALLTLLRSEYGISHVEIETNGTRVVTPELDDLCDQYNVSVKLENSGNSHALRIKKDAMDFFSQSPKSNFKFVVATPEDLNEIEILRDNYSIPASKIVLMPLGTTTEALNSRETWLAELCKERSYRFSDRMHIRLFGNKRGV